jgi:hypothetical protein
MLLTIESYLCLTFDCIKIGIAADSLMCNGVTIWFNDAQLSLRVHYHEIFTSSFLIKRICLVPPYVIVYWFGDTVKSMQWDFKIWSSFHV